MSYNGGRKGYRVFRMRHLRPGGSYVEAQGRLGGLPFWPIRHADHGQTVHRFKFGVAAQRQRNHYRTAPTAALGRMRMPGASSLAILYISSAMEFPRMARPQLATGNKVTPSEYRSEQSIHLLARQLLGVGKLGVPNTKPVLVLFRPVIRAIPKSVTFTVSGLRLVHDVGRFDIAVSTTCCGK